VANAGAARLVELGASSKSAARIVTLARTVAEGKLRLAPGGNLTETRRALTEIVGGLRANAIAMRTLYWPDAFPAQDRALQRAVGMSTARALRVRAEQWRPWRAYAAVHLWLTNDLAAFVTSPGDGATPGPGSD
jgi:AraC family transcriptional regulator of adaptative response / DNA-3-methyladenine glycosylase II